MKILTGFPTCSHPGCQKVAEDGYCDATCCKSQKAYCSEHSHRPIKVLEILGYTANGFDYFTIEQVLDIVKAMWVGAGMVFESAGYLKMLQEVKDKQQGEPDVPSAKE